MQEQYTRDCPVCNAKEQYSEPYSYDHCSICGWQDDWQQVDDPDETGANKLTLNQAQKMWANGETIKSWCPNPKQNSKQPIFRNARMQLEQY